MTNGEQECVDAAIAPPDNVGRGYVHSVEQGCVVIRHHFEGEGMAGIHRSALRTAVGEDDLVVRCEIWNVPREGAHVAVVAMNHQQGRSAAIDFGLHLEPVDVVELAGGLIVVVRN